MILMIICSIARTIWFAMSVKASPGRLGAGGEVAEVAENGLSKDWPS
jgi:hypothetical protein